MRPTPLELAQETLKAADGRLTMARRRMTTLLPGSALNADLTPSDVIDAAYRLMQATHAYREARNVLAAVQAALHERRACHGPLVEGYCPEPGCPNGPPNPAHYTGPDKKAAQCIQDKTAAALRKPFRGVRLTAAARAARIAEIEEELAAQAALQNEEA